MITIIFPYRNREAERVKRSLDSLEKQTNQDFKVIFVDYGSNSESEIVIKELVLQYSFVDYIYNFSEFQPWSRAKAINIGLRKVNTEYVFTADIDMIFRSDFISKLYELKHPSKTYYFKVGFLNELETKINKKFEDYSAYFTSEIGAQGLSMFSVKKVEEINGYDEFLHFWGAEDNDIHNRLERIGIESVFYNEEVLLLHQWHTSYRRGEVKGLTRDLQLTNIVRVNQQHLLRNNQTNKTILSNKNWGIGVSKSDFEELKTEDELILLSNTIEVITHFLFCELPSFENRIIEVRIVEDVFQNSLKYKMKKLFRKTVPKYYSLKEINDMFLLHIISFYHTCPYSYEVSSDLKNIIFKIKK